MTSARQVLPFRSPGPPPVVAPDARVYAIGDVHGRLDLMVSLLRQIVADGARLADGRQTKIVFLGDYIDRGEQSRGVLAALTAMARWGSEHVIFLRGNHEDALRFFLFSPSEGAEWFDFGGLQTLASLGITGPRLRHGRQDLFRIRQELSEAIAPFDPLFQALRSSWRSGDVFFSHAGADPAHAAADQGNMTLLWGRDADQGPTPLPGLRVVHGHFEADRPVVLPGRVCVDTGAYHSGCLTAIRLDDGSALLQTV